MILFIFLFISEKNINGEKTILCNLSTYDIFPFEVLGMVGIGKDTGQLGLP